MKTSPSHHRTLSPRRQYAIAAAAACLGVVCSVTVLLALRSWEREWTVDDFVRAAADRESALVGNLGFNQVVISSLQLLFMASQEVEPYKFHSFTTPLLFQEPSIQAMEWVPHVRGADRASFEANARAAIRPDFQITERSERGLQVRSECEEYFPVGYVEPYKGNEPALGFDLASESVRREAMQRARDTGQPAATAPILLVQEKGNETGYLVFLPVYKKGPVPASVEERRASLAGFVLGVSRALATLTDAVGQLTSVGIDTCLLDSTSPGRPQFLCFRPSPARTRPLTEEEYFRHEPPGGLRSEKTFDMAGRKWTVVCTATPDFVASRTTPLPWAGLAAGLLLTAALTFHLSNTARHVARVGCLMDEVVATNEELTAEVAERKRAEEALRESQQRFAQVAESAGELIWEIDAEGLFLYCNAVCDSLFGYTAQEIVGKMHCIDFLSPDVKDEQVRVIRAVLARKEPIRSLVTKNVHRNGKVVYQQTSGLPVLDDQGNLLCYRGVNVDITERRHAEEALRESREFLSKIINCIRDPIFVMDEQDRFVLVNDALCALHGWSREESLGKTTHDLLPPELADRYVRINEEVLATGLDNVTEEPTIDAQGRHLTLVTKKSRYVSPDDRRYVVGNLRDITESKRAEEALRESREFLHKIINTIRDPIFVQDDQHRFVLANDALCAFDNMPREELLGKTIRDFLRPEEVEGLWSVEEQVLLTGQDQTHEEQVTIPPRPPAVLLTKTSRYVDPAGRRFVVGVIRDITGRKRLEDELRESHDLLEQRVRERTAELVAANQQIRRAQTDLVQAEKMSMLGLLAAGIAHEINTPTGAILNVVADSYGHLRQLVGLGAAFTQLPPPTWDWMGRLLEEVLGGASVRSEPAIRAERRRIEGQLRQSGAEDPRRLAEVIVSCGLAGRVDEGLLQHLAQGPVLTVLEHVLAMKAASDITQSSARKIARIVRALRSYSREENAAPGRLDVNESVDNTLVILQHRLKHVPEVGIRLAEGLPAASCGPELAQVWTNLLNNACDALELSKLEHPGRIEVSTRLDGGRVIVAFSNNGPAIPEEVKRRMYEPFFTTKPVGKGTGLGLSICASILERYGATLVARNEEGRVTFEVSIPAGEVREGPGAADRATGLAKIGRASEGGLDS